MARNRTTCSLFVWMHLAIILGAFVTQKIDSGMTSIDWLQVRIFKILLLQARNFFNVASFYV